MRLGGQWGLNKDSIMISYIILSIFFFKSREKHTCFHGSNINFIGVLSIYVSVAVGVSHLSTDGYVVLLVEAEVPQCVLCQGAG